LMTPRKIGVVIPSLYSRPYRAFTQGVRKSHAKVRQDNRRFTQIEDG
jgi:hypothetical protein